jgi:hypothetical protein
MTRTEVRAIINEIARATLWSNNQVAWREIDARLIRAGISSRQAATIREFVWAERRELLKLVGRHRCPLLDWKL